MINMIYSLLIVFLISFNQDIKRDIKVNQNAKASVSNSVKSNDDKRIKIEKFIKLVQPKYSSEKCEKIANIIFQKSDVYKIDPYLTASVAYVESEFSMNSRPCIGMMQLTRGSIRYYDPKRKHNPYSVEGNFEIGLVEMSHHFSNLSKNSSIPSRSTTRQVLLRYNGSRLKYTYAVKVLRVKNRLEKLNIEEIKSLIKRKSLWTI